MSIVLKEINRLDKLITEFLDYASPEPALDDMVNLSQLMTELVESIKLDGLSDGVDFDVHIESGVSISGNRDKLKQALLNIMKNGLQAMESRSSKKLELSLEKGQKDTLLKLKDYGMGIPEPQLKKIFEPFHTTKPKGTGLGLAIVHSILDSHKADVDVQSEDGKWTEFTIRF